MCNCYFEPFVTGFAECSFNFFCIFLVTFAHLLLQIAEDLVTCQIFCCGLESWFDCQWCHWSLKLCFAGLFTLLGGACNLDWSSEKPFFFSVMDVKQTWQFLIYAGLAQMALERSFLCNFVFLRVFKDFESYPKTLTCSWTFSRVLMVVCGLKYEFLCQKSLPFSLWIGTSVNWRFWWIWILDWRLLEILVLEGLAWIGDFGS